MTHVGKWSFGLPAAPHVPFMPVPCAHVQERRDQTVPRVGMDEEACAMANIDLIHSRHRQGDVWPGCSRAPVTRMWGAVLGQK